MSYICNMSITRLMQEPKRLEDPISLTFNNCVLTHTMLSRDKTRIYYGMMDYVGTNTRGVCQLTEDKVKELLQS